MGARPRRTSGAASDSSNQSSNWSSYSETHRRKRRPVLRFGEEIVGEVVEVVLMHQVAAQKQEEDHCSLPVNVDSAVACRPFPPLLLLPEGALVLELGLGRGRRRNLEVQKRFGQVLDRIPARQIEGTGSLRFSRRMR